MITIQKSMMIMMTRIRDRGLEERGDERIQVRGIGSKTMRVTDKWQVKKRNEDKHKISNWYRVIESKSKNDREGK